MIFIEVGNVHGDETLVVLLDRKSRGDQSASK